MTTLRVNEQNITTTNDEPASQGAEIPVVQVLENVAQGLSLEEIAAQWPGVASADVKAALEHAITAIRQPLVPAQESKSSDRVRDNHALPEMDLNKILVVDDQPLNCRLVKQILARSEFTLSFASDGQEGLEKARAELPFLVLSDIMMPRMDGFELCEKLKADDRTKDAAVIFVTAHHRDAAMVSKGLDMGADDYIYRPFQPNELEARVRAVARLKRAEMTARRRAHVIARRNDELEFLNTLALAATSSLSLQESLAPSMPKLAQLLGAKAVALLLLDAHGAKAHGAKAHGAKAHGADAHRARAHVNITTHKGQSLATSVDFCTEEELTLQTLVDQVPLVLAEILDDSNGSLDIVSPDACTISTVPMISRDQIIGAMGVIHAEGNILITEDMMLLNSVAGIMSVANENARLLAEVQEFNRHLEQMVEERTRQLVEEKKKTEAILASMADGLLVLDAENRVLTANRTAEEMLGFRLGQLQGQPIGEERLNSPLWRCVNDMAASPEPIMSALVELPDAAQTDSSLSIQARSAKIRDESGAAPRQAIGTVIVLRDITALKEVERMKTRFMAGVTHELKTPLAVIRVHANNLSTYHERLPIPKQKEILGTIQKQVILLERSVEDILALTRLDAGAMEIEREPVDLGVLADEIVVSMRPLAEPKQIALRWKKPAAAVMTIADPRIITRVIRNLVDNAIKYTPAGGMVKVQTIPTTIEGQPYVEVQVKDTGMGVAPEHQEQIFERFYRVDPSHTTPGTGLGLAIVKEIVEAHSGVVKVESLPGVGSTFTVTLPGIDPET
ncbi:MAG: hypothetical protein DRJ03_05785 [Chloroflexi bacterium]|nr:MAG: hypothetical protein DRI81_04360 [Chloroflexota bacterium]RLC87517.1 MAG: hypothetical protein DRJ03_05785 [Chloroflexota bacterium]